MLGTVNMIPFDWCVCIIHISEEQKALASTRRRILRVVQAATVGDLSLSCLCFWETSFIRLKGFFWGLWQVCIKRLILLAQGDGRKSLSTSRDMTDKLLLPYRKANVQCLTALVSLGFSSSVSCYSEVICLASSYCLLWTHLTLEGDVLHAARNIQSTL